MHFSNTSFSISNKNKKKTQESMIGKPRQDENLSFVGISSQRVVNTPSSERVSVHLSKILFQFRVVYFDACFHSSLIFLQLRPTLKDQA